MHVRRSRKEETRGEICFVAGFAVTDDVKDCFKFAMKEQFSHTAAVSK